jgi:sugar lactone lactonase YvrE
MHKSYDLDFFARAWVPSRHTCSVMVLDSNMNRIARLGRYGNIDDADPACGKMHFSCPQSLAVSDAALYVADTGNRRIVRAAISYETEEAVPVP